MKKSIFALNKNLIRLSFVFIFFLSPLLSGCNNQKSVDFFALNTNIHVESYSSSIDKNTQKSLKTALNKVENSFSISKSSSFVYKFNNLNAGEKVTLTNEESTVFSLAKEYYIDTKGLFNVAVYPLKELWQNKNPKGQINFFLPENNEIENIKPLCNLDNVLSFDGETKTLTKKVNGAKIDLGGLVKGYALDKTVAILKNAGIKDGYVSIGSSSMHLFNVKSLSIRHPRHTNSSIIKITDNINGKSISTSGDYENCFGIKDGKYYSHVLDCNTGFPTDTGVISATVIGNNGATLDALSTTLMLLDYNEITLNQNEIINYVKNNFKFFIVYNNGEKKEIITNEQTDNFTLLDNEYQIVKI